MHICIVVAVAGRRCACGEMHHHQQSGGSSVVRRVLCSVCHLNYIVLHAIYSTKSFVPFYFHLASHTPNYPAHWNPSSGQAPAVQNRNKRTTANCDDMHTYLYLLYRAEVVYA